MMRLTVMAWGGCWLLLVSTGCNPVSMATSAAGAAYKVVRGAEADPTLIRGAVPAELAAYRSLRLGEVTTDVPPICTGEVLAKVRAAIIEQLGDQETVRAFPGGGKVLRFDVLCRFFKERGLIGGEGRLDWMVTLKDVESDVTAGVIFVEGVSGSPLQHGVRDMARENTKELVRFLDRRRQGLPR